MSAILIISVFLIFVASLALLRTKRPRSDEGAEQLPPPFGSRGLFADIATRPPGDGGEAGAEGGASEEPGKSLRARAESLGVTAERLSADVREARSTTRRARDTSTRHKD